MSWSWGLWLVARSNSGPHTTGESLTRQWVVVGGKTICYSIEEQNGLGLRGLGTGCGGHGRRTSPSPSTWLELRLKTAPVIDGCELWPWSENPWSDGFLLFILPVVIEPKSGSMLWVDFAGLFWGYSCTGLCFLCSKASLYLHVPHKLWLLHLIWGGQGFMLCKCSWRLQWESFTIFVYFLTSKEATENSPKEIPPLFSQFSFSS